ncbi:MAG: aminopeptidase [Solirubrobacteraceae bacterium]
MPARGRGVIDAARFADLLVGYCLGVDEQEQVLVRGSTLAAPLMLEVQRAVLERGGWPLLRAELPGATPAFYAHARDWQLDDYAPLALTEVRKATCVLGIQAPEGLHPLADVEPERLRRATLARKPLRDAVMKSRWCSTLWPTPAAAEQAGLALAAYEKLLAGALFLTEPNPPAAWRRLAAFQAGLIERLSGVRELRIEAPGTDLRLRVARRRWINSDGRRNMPSGEVFTGPVEDSADGTVRFTIPSAPAGVEVAGVELRFEAGEVVDASAATGEAYLQRMLQTDAGARRLGEVGIGTNFGIARPVGAILFDEKIGGTVHLALGRSYPETGGKNSSAMHWDLICDLRQAGRLSGDGEILMENGRFSVA